MTGNDAADGSVIALSSFYELCGNANTVSCLAHTALGDIGDAELVGNVADVERLSDACG